MLIVAGILFYFFSNDFIVNEVIRAWEWTPASYKDLDQKYGSGIVLGGYLNPELEPRDRPHLNKSAGRIVHACMLYHRDAFHYLITSGGNARVLGDKTAKEANATRPLLEDLQIPENAYILENKARNTYENALYSRQIIDSLGLSAEKHLLFTSAFHMHRAVGCFQKMGIRVVPFPVDYQHHERKWTPDSLFLPSADALLKWETLIKEWLGIFVYRLQGYM